MHARSFVAALAALTLAGSTLAGITAVGAAASSAAPAAKGKPTVSTVAKGLVGPLSVAEGADGTRYWADTFAGRLYEKAPASSATVIYKNKSAAPEGVSIDEGLLRFTTGSEDNKKGLLWTIDPMGDPLKIANIYRYEKSANPDGTVRYGFLNTPKSCRDKLPRQIPAGYKGIKESHPYATATLGGVTYVADAGANAVFAVSLAGEVSTVAVIKPAKVKITRPAAKALGLPACTIGKKYAFESVPTDIEVGPDGKLYLTSLPGGPEDGSLGAQGRVLKVDPASGKVRTVVRGLITPTGLAVAENGDLFIAQLFAGVISKVKAGSTKVKTYLKVPLPAAVEVIPGGLLATINALPVKKPKGKVVTITP